MDWSCTLLAEPKASPALSLNPGGTTYHHVAADPTLETGPLGSTFVSDPAKNRVVMQGR